MASFGEISCLKPRRKVAASLRNFCFCCRISIPLKPRHSSCPLVNHAPCAFWWWAFLPAVVRPLPKMSAFRARYSFRLSSFGVGRLARCERFAFPVAVEFFLPNCLNRVKQDLNNWHNHDKNRLNKSSKKIPRRSRGWKKGGEK